MAVLAVSTVMAVAGGVLYVSDQQSPHFKSDADYVMAGENKNFNSFKPKNNTPKYNNIEQELEIIEREQFTPNFSATSSAGRSLSESGSAAMPYSGGADRAVGRSSSSSSRGSGGSGMMAIGARKSSSGFTTSTPNMMGASSKGATHLSEPFETPKQKGGGLDWGDLTPPDDEDSELGPPLPVGKGLYILMIMGLFYFLLTNRKIYLNQKN